MKMTIISDTHGMHSDLNVPDSDVLIHCGDVSPISSQSSIERFAEWFEGLPNENKIVIAGNHDKYMSRTYFESAIYLEDELIEIDGVKFYGAPWTPIFNDWYFMLNEEEIRNKWDLIPDVDVLITHGPPANLGSLSSNIEWKECGCKELEIAVNRVRPKIHCFGHIHEGYGMTEKNGTQFINASSMNFHYQISNKAVEIEI